LFINNNLPRSINRYLPSLLITMWHFVSCDTSEQQNEGQWAWNQEQAQTSWEMRQAAKDFKLYPRSQWVICKCEIRCREEMTCLHLCFKYLVLGKSVDELETEEKQCGETLSVKRQ
jgi:hypothetical protein